MKIDLFYFENKTHAARKVWALGETYILSRQVKQCAENIKDCIEKSKAEFVLFWDLRLGDPDPEAIQRISELPGDLWHAGLKLGMQGKPGLIDFLRPTWMLNRDPEANVVATSWRMSLKACLVKADVLKQLGSIKSDYQTLECAALELGHRYIHHGVAMRHIPELLTAPAQSQEKNLFLLDEIRFVCDRFSRLWRFWAWGRAFFSGYAAKSRLFPCFL